MSQAPEESAEPLASVDPVPGGVEGVEGVEGVRALRRASGVFPCSGQVAAEPKK
jgi:hypothetical protein